MNSAIDFDNNGSIAELCEYVFNNVTILFVALETFFLNKFFIYGNVWLTYSWPSKSSTDLYDLCGNNGNNKIEYIDCNLDLR